MGYFFCDDFLVVVCSAYAGPGEPALEVVRGVVGEAKNITCHLPPSNHSEIPKWTAEDDNSSYKVISHDGGIIENTPLCPNCSITESGGKWILTIRDLRLTDNRRYACSLSNEKDQSAVTLLQVQGNRCGLFSIRVYFRQLAHRNTQ